jgi:UDP-GlcNAc:undecaprenyl-phosphate/decaprenyl-phosphate GlcNAc-1-phosphate transferase
MHGEAVAAGTPATLYWGLAISIICALVLVSVGYRRFREWGIVAENLEGRQIVTGLGVAVVATGIATSILAAPFHFGTSLAGLLLLHGALLIAMALVGLLDDLFPDPRGVSGFVGHFGAALLHGKLTRGALKAVVGGVVALWIGLHLAGKSVGEGILDALIIALAANVLNLLDVRPGRAVKWWALGAIVPLLAPDTLPFLAPLAIALLVYSPLDFRRLAMLGDAGVLPLGASLGFCWCIVLPDGPAGFWLRLATVVLLASANLYAEFASLSRIIRGNPLLEFCDSLWVGPLAPRRSERTS